MLGNMQFIGQLYKYALLTERIMHNCVQQLLQVGGFGSFVICEGDIGDEINHPSKVIPPAFILTIRPKLAVPSIMFLVG